jgi:hypothetical protein
MAGLAGIPGDLPCACRDDGMVSPEKLRLLVPEFLTELPIDPFDPANGPLRDTNTGGDFVAYSVGVDGKDDGGRPPHPDETGWFDFEQEGDLRLDVYLAPADESNGAGQDAIDAEGSGDADAAEGK